MRSPDYQQWSITALVILLVLGWLLVPWLGLMAFLCVPAFVFCVLAGLLAVSTIEEWLRELREGRRSHGGGSR